MHTLIERNPPPPGDFFFGWFPHERPGGRGALLKNNPNFCEKI